MLDGLHGGGLDEEGEPAQIVLSASNFGTFPMSNGLSRLESRFYGDDDTVAKLRQETGRRIEAAEAIELGLVTDAPDDIDWEDEIRIMLEERASLSPDALTGMEANHRFVGPETMEIADLRPAHRLAELDLRSTQRVRPRRRAAPVRHGTQGRLRPEAGVRHTCRIDYSEKIPNNVDLAGDRKLQRALESWQPNFLNWWKTMGPAIPTEDVYLRTAVAVGREGWAHFDHVAMEEYRWGVFLAERNADRGSPSASRRASRSGSRCPASTAPTCSA